MYTIGSSLLKPAISVFLLFALLIVVRSGIKRNKLRVISGCYMCYRCSNGLKY